MSVPPTKPANALHEKLEKLVREAYLESPVPGFRLPSEKDQAQLFGVSVPTLRKVLKRLVAEGCLEQRQGSGTFVRAEAPKLVGILCNVDLSTLRYPESTLMELSACQRLLAERGFRVRVYLGNENAGLHDRYSVPVEFRADIERGVLAGVIALDAFPTPAWMSTLAKRKIPVVGKGELHLNMVTANFLLYILKAATRLRELGRTRVAYIGSPENCFPGNRFSYCGASAVWDNHTIRSILEGVGLEVRDEWFHAQWLSNPQGKSWSALREIWIGRERPDGIILENPALAEDAFLAIRECGISVPEQLTIVGSWMVGAHSAPPAGMEVVGYDVRKISENLVDMIEEAIRSGKIANPRRIIDWSTSAPRTDSMPIFQPNIPAS